MSQIFWLTLRQLAGVRRLSLVGLLALLPLGLTLLGRLLSDEGGSVDESITVLVDGLAVSAVMPLIVMSLATVSFGSEVEDRTLSYIALKPVARWKIALAKLLAPLALAAPLVTVSVAAAAYIELSALGDGAARSTLAVAVALLAGVFTYCSLFTWLGLVTSRALALAIVYVFLWEGLVVSFIGGASYLSARGYVLGVMYGLDREGMEALSERAVELPAAVVGAVVVSILFFGLTTRRLKTMDIP